MKPKFCKCTDCKLTWRSNVRHHQTKCPRCKSRLIAREKVFVGAMRMGRVGRAGKAGKMGKRK
jgi:predicted Zn-ribbon and HTH transcriptional regulator